MATELTRRYYYVTPTVKRTARGGYHKAKNCPALAVNPWHGTRQRPLRLTVTQLCKLLHHWVQSRCKTNPVRACKRCSKMN